MTVVRWYVRTIRRQSTFKYREGIRRYRESDTKRRSGNSARLDSLPEELAHVRSSISARDLSACGFGGSWRPSRLGK